MPRKQRFTEDQIIDALKEIEAGTAPAEICSRMGVDERIVARWQSLFGDIAMSGLQRMRHLQKENAQLKKMIAEVELDKQMLRSALKKCSRRTL